MVSVPLMRAHDAVGAAIDALATAQEETGEWQGDYSGPHFLLPMYLSACYATGTMPDDHTRRRMVAYIRHSQNTDGGFGLGEETPSCVFTSVLNYVALRMLAVPAGDPDATRLRRWFLARGGPLAAASWGRFVLCLLNLHDWRGVHPIPPETWLLPYAVPVHPARLWCHARQVYLPMSWLYGTKSQLPLDPFLRQLRTEIYEVDYNRIDWSSTIDRIAPEDCYAPHSPLMRTAHRLMHAWEAVCPGVVRGRALDEVLEHITYEDITGDYICIGPVNKVLDTLVWHFAQPGGVHLQRHLERLPDYLSTDERGTRMNGYNNSRLWDTAFAIQALLATGRAEARSALERANHYLDAAQVITELHELPRYYRDPRQWAWPFSNRAHGWPITDCTGEGLSAALLLRDQVDGALPDERLVGAVERMLEKQNPDGGWASYEKVRGPRWLHQLNPSDIFGDIMIDNSFVECTSSVVHGLAQWNLNHPDTRVSASISRGRDYMLSIQRPDGSWEGNWGVCFTYGTWFGVRGLRACGLQAHHPALQRAATFLGTIQLQDGGWGETILSCRERRVVPTEAGQPVQTAWAVLTLIDAGQLTSEACQRGIDFLRRTQLPDGSWRQTAITGVFNRTCSIAYPNYALVFPTWALGLAERSA